MTADIAVGIDYGVIDDARQRQRRRYDRYVVIGLLAAVTGGIAVSTFASGTPGHGGGQKPVSLAPAVALVENGGSSAARPAPSTGALSESLLMSRTPKEVTEDPATGAVVSVTALTPSQFQALRAQSAGG
jgi:hypothetical protein